MASKASKFDHQFKILIIGDSNVGKSSILLRFTENIFLEDTPSSLGLDYKEKLVSINNKQIMLYIWDTAGQEKFRSLTSSYYRGTHGVIFVYDVSNTDSFNHLKNWIKEVDLYANDSPIAQLVLGNKTDLTNNIDLNQLQQLCHENSLQNLFCSAKTGQGVEEAMLKIVSNILNIPELCQKPNPQPIPQSKPAPQNLTANNSSCC
eukprot:TRINITY_DN153_c0_g1_i4.p1 TRINITY_DN153_c0_g1~~TRINITY_DN153_c0_g1_i4.p1  ORF type:complete len:205 (-),score=19.91 TRINITY_DN153_c0_g1_i4:98-712(-)